MHSISASLEPAAERSSSLAVSVSEHGGSCRRGDSSVEGLMGFTVQGNRLLPSSLSVYADASHDPFHSSVFMGVEGDKEAGLSLP